MDTEMTRLQKCNESLLKQNEELTKKVAELELRIKKYTNGENHKRYYEKNKEKYKELGASYLQNLKTENPEKLKEYRRTAYDNKKMKKLKEKEAAELAEYNRIITDNSANIIMT
jgi:hypothetical protein